MATQDRYAFPADEELWNVSAAYDTTFRWEYEEARDKLVGLYKKGKKQQLLPTRVFLLDLGLVTA